VRALFGYGPAIEAILRTRAITERRDVRPTNVKSFASRSALDQRGLAGSSAKPGCAGRSLGLVGQTRSLSARGALAPDHLVTLGRPVPFVLPSARRVVVRTACSSRGSDFPGRLSHPFGCTARLRC
jgi:hypothetical protein